MSLLDDIVSSTPLGFTPLFATGLDKFTPAGVAGLIGEGDSEQSGGSQEEGADIAGILEQALALSERLFNEARTESREVLSPFVQAGTSAIPGVQQAIGGFGQAARGLAGDVQAGGFDPRGLSFTVDLDSPEFQSILEGGVRAIDAAAATGGLIGHGGRLRALQQEGQQKANLYTGDILNRRINLANALLRPRLSALDALRGDISNRQSLVDTGLRGAGLLSSGLFGAASGQAGLGSNILGNIASVGQKEQSLAQAEALRQQAIEEQKRNQIFSLLGTAIGGGLGFMGGGPAGAAAGASIGGGLGSKLG